MKKKYYYLNLIRLSAGASLLIGLGNFVLLKVGEPLGPFLFSFGLLGVCVLGLNLFTGKCGFLIQDGIKFIDLFTILITNLVFGYAIGVLFSLIDESITVSAANKVATWSFSWQFFLKSVACGVIMYLAVETYRRGTKLGILIGVPLFIFCGFQHSIANVITMGVAIEFSWTIVLAVLGNFLGSIITWMVAGSFDNLEASRRTAAAGGSATTRKAASTTTPRATPRKAAMSKTAATTTDGRGSRKGR